MSKYIIDVSEKFSRGKWWIKGQYIWQAIYASQYNSWENTEICVHTVTVWPQFKYFLWLFVSIKLEPKCLSIFEKKYQIQCHYWKKLFLRIVEWFLIHIYLVSLLFNNLWLCTNMFCSKLQIIKTIRFKGV